MSSAVLLDEVAVSGKRFLESNDDQVRKDVIAAANKLIQELEKPYEILSRIGMDEPTRTAALRTAFDLGMLEKLTNQPQTSKTLALATGAKPELAARILKHLAAHGLVKEVGMDEYVETQLSKSIDQPVARGGWTFSFECYMPVFKALPEFLAKTDYKSPTSDADGPAQYGLNMDKPIYDYLREDNPRLGNAFNAFMADLGTNQRRWIDFYPAQERLGGVVAKGPLFVDIGGGLGHEISALHAKCPDLAGGLVLQDKPVVIAEAQASGNLPSTIIAMAHDFFEPQPTECRGARAYFMKYIMHNWPEDKCALILSHVRDAMVPGHSRLILTETVMRDVGASSQQTSLDWIMMGMLVARERTESQWRELLAGVGLKISGLWLQDDGLSVIEAVLEGDS